MSQQNHPMLESKDLAKSYAATDPPARVINGIDLQVRTGEFLVVMGASGSGKSTLLYLLSGMERPSHGEVFLAGEELTTLDESQMSRIRLTRMGFIFQQAYFLANLNIRDNILLPALKAAPGAKAAAIARVEALMERFGISHLREHSITEVSGGQLQRASMCRALACEPAILFADEPTGSLNSSLTIEAMDALSEVHRGGTTVVLVTHDPLCAARGDRVLYLRDGQLVESRDLGPWSRQHSAEREEELLGWLGSMGF